MAHEFIRRADEAGGFVIFYGGLNHDLARIVLHAVVNRAQFFFRQFRRHDFRRNDIGFETRFLQDVHQVALVFKKQAGVLLVAGDDVRIQVAVVDMLRPAVGRRDKGENRDRLVLQQVCRDGIDDLLRHAFWEHVDICGGVEIKAMLGHVLEGRAAGFAAHDHALAADAVKVGQQTALRRRICRHDHRHAARGEFIRRERERGVEPRLQAGILAHFERRDRSGIVQCGIQVEFGLGGHNRPPRHKAVQTKAKLFAVQPVTLRPRALAQTVRRYLTCLSGVLLQGRPHWSGAAGHWHVRWKYYLPIRLSECKKKSFSYPRNTKEISARIFRPRNSA